MVRYALVRVVGYGLDGDLLAFLGPVRGVNIPDFGLKAGNGAAFNIGLYHALNWFSACQTCNNKYELEVESR